jgi:putative phosphotransacetylase
MLNKIPVGVSNRHIHLTEKDLFTLFGEGYKLTNVKFLTQPGQFAAKETVVIRGVKGEIQNVRVLGPVRKASQVEISKTDMFTLGVIVPVRMSGDIKGTPGIEVIGPNGSVTLQEGLIIAKRHIHMHPDEAKQFGVQDNDVVQVKTSGERALIFDQVVIRVHETFALDFHIDIDEANAAGLKTGDTIQLVKTMQRVSQYA